MTCLHPLEPEELQADADLLAGRLLVELADEVGGLDVDVGGQKFSLSLDDPALAELMSIAVRRAFAHGQLVVLNTAMGRRTCKVCGCWEMEACAGGCAWAGPAICDACAPAGSDANVFEAGS